MATIIKEFTSIWEFEQYIYNTPINSIFRWETLASSQKLERGYNQTNSFDEAINLLKHGWDEKAKVIEQGLKLIANQIQPTMVNRARYDVVGFEASVPRYLQGVPTNMVNTHKVVTKQKVITIVKHIGYRADVSAQTIIENSIKALQIVKKIEAQGYRVNLDVISPAETYSGEKLVCRLRIKSASERTNISKLAFPLAHPDMLRRMIFRFREVCPDITDKSWAGGYGATIYDKNQIKSFLKQGEYYLHNFISSVDDEIKNMKLQ